MLIFSRNFTYFFAKLILFSSVITLIFFHICIFFFRIFRPFYRDFNRQHSRPVMSYDDIQPVANEYIRYKVSERIFASNRYILLYNIKLD